MIVCALFDETGLPLVRAPIDVTWPDSESPVRLTTDERGLCESSWTGYSTGDYHVRTEFPGNDDYLAASAVREFRLYAPIQTQLEMRFPDADSATDPVWKTGEQSWSYAPWSTRRDSPLRNASGHHLAGLRITRTAGD